MALQQRGMGAPTSLATGDVSSQFSYGRPMKGELSAHAPIRLRGLAYYQYPRNAVSMGWITTDGMIRQGLHEDVERVLVHPATQFVIRSALAGDLPGSAADQTMAKIPSYSDWVPLFGQYEACGKQIFDLHDSLTELLKHTDVNERTLEDLRLPYDCSHGRRRRATRTPCVPGAKFRPA